MAPAVRLLAFLLVCAAALAPRQGHAQPYPARTVRFVVGASAGGGMDTMARLVAKGLTDIWHQPVIVDDRPGSGDVLAGQYVAHAAPDGYTLLLTDNAFTVDPSQMKLPYDPLTAFAPITMLGIRPQLLLVNPKFPTATLKDLVAYARENPGKVNFSSSGNGSPTYLQMLLFMRQTGTDMVNVSYGGGSQSLLGVVGGEVQIGFVTISSSRGQVTSGLVKPLAITSAKRLASYPDVPTIAEALDRPGFKTAPIWDGILAPAGTPPAIVESIRHAAMRVISGADAQKLLLPDGFTPVGNTPAEYGAFIKSDIAQWKSILPPIAQK